MTIIIGLVITLGAMIGGFMAMGGHVEVIWQPWEYVIICGAALGTFVVANPMKTIKDVGTGLIEVFLAPTPKPREYLDVLVVLHQLRGLTVARIDILLVTLFRGAGEHLLRHGPEVGEERLLRLARIVNEREKLVRELVVVVVVTLER